MSKDYAAITRDISAYTAEMRKLVPQTMQAFYGLSKSAGADGQIDAKTKELIALAIGVTQRCDESLTGAAHALGATRAWCRRLSASGRPICRSTGPTRFGGNSVERARLSRVARSSV